MSSAFQNLQDRYSFNFAASTDTTEKVRSIIILGENLDIDSGTVPETIWEPGGLYVFPTQATTCTVVSSSAQDTVTTGTGAWYVLIEGLDSNYRELMETIVMNGTNTVTSSNKYFRINTARVVYSGTSKGNVGNITLTVDSKTVRYIAIGESIDHTAVFTVPLDHTFFPLVFNYNTLKSTTNIVTVASKVYVPSINTIVASSYSAVSGHVGLGSSDIAFARIPEKADYWLDVEYASTTNIEVTTTIRGHLVKNGFIQRYN